MTEKSASHFLRQFEQHGPLVILGLAISLLVVPAGAFNFSVPAVVLGLLLAGLPLAMAEQAMATRAKVSIVPGMQLLTRESDAPRFWRILSWSSLGASIAASSLVAVVAGEKSTQAMQTLLRPMGFAIHGSDFWPLLTVFVLLLGAMRAIRQVPLRLWLLPVLLLLVLRVMQVFSGHYEPMQSDLMRTVTLPASGGLLLGIFAVGAGMGAHWVQFDRDGRWAWMERLVAMTSFAGIFWSLQAGPATLITLLLGAIIMLLSLRALMEPFLAHARDSQWPPIVAPIVMLIPTTLLAEMVWVMGGNDALPTLVKIMAGWVSINLMLTALYSGWVMKISHLRKALALPSEATYNLWRILVRWVAPIMILTAWWQVYRG